MKRREFIAATSALLAGNFPVQAQPPARIARVGVLLQGLEASSAPYLKALTDGLAAQGWKSGQNLAIAARYAGGKLSDLPKLAEDLARTKPDVILCGGPSAVVAVQKLGLSIPVVFVVVANPVKLGLAKSLGRPGGNFTGLATINPDVFLAKQIELLHEIVPRATRIAFLLNPDNPMMGVQGAETGIRIARSRKLEPVVVHARIPEELAGAFAEAAAQKSELLYVMGDGLFMGQRPLVAELALRHRLAAMFLFHQHVEDGGLISYGIDIAEHYRHAATYIDKILKGAVPRDLPIEEPSTYVLAVNMKTAKALGLKIPQSVLLRADRVIE